METAALQHRNREDTGTLEKKKSSVGTIQIKSLHQAGGSTETEDEKEAEEKKDLRKSIRRPGNNHPPSGKLLRARESYRTREKIIHRKSRRGVETKVKAKEGSEGFRLEYILLRRTRVVAGLGCRGGVRWEMWE